jgi:C_GCAxxG_C_C family probable redox protein
MKRLFAALFKKQTPQLEAGVAEQCGQAAEALYRTGKYHCAEAVLEVIRKQFRPDVPEDVIGMVTGFGGGSGSGCICGAVSGATVAIGLALNGDKKQTAELTKELHKWFKAKYGATCCNTIRKTHKKVCPLLTGEVARKTAELLMGR